MEPFGRKNALPVKCGGIEAGPTVKERLAHPEHFNGAFTTADEQLGARRIPSDKEGDHGSAQTRRKFNAVEQ